MFSTEYLPGFGLADKVEDFIGRWEDSGEFITAHTSGSTGEPKPVSLPKRDMLVSARATNLRFGINEESVLLCPLSPDYIAGKMMIVRAIAASCRLMFCQPSNRFILSEEVGRLTSRDTVDLLPVVPSQCQEIDSPELIRNIRNIIIGGAPLSAAGESRLLELSAEGQTRFFATYGMTETCSHVALRRLGSKYYEALPGITFSTDSRGCLRIDAPAYSFGSLQTNDIVSLRSPVSFEWHGRHDNVINSGGIKLFPEEIERTLAPHLPFPLYIKGIESRKWGTEAALVCLASAPLTDEAILAICRDVLPQVKVPKSVIRLESFSYTSSGKLRRL